MKQSRKSKIDHIKELEVKDIEFREEKEEPAKEETPAKEPVLVRAAIKVSAAGNPLKRMNMDRFNEKYAIIMLYASVILEIVIESVCRHSLWKGVRFLFTRPIMFVFNALIIYLFYIFGTFFRRRIMYFSFITVVLFALGLTNGILLSFRTTPFAAVDFLLIPSAIRIVHLYLPIPLLIVIIAAIVLAIIGCVILGFKVRKFKGKMHRIFTVIFTAGFFFFLVGVNHLLVRFNIATENFSNLADAYKDYGFMYCFSNSVLNLGMDKPADYSPEVVDAIIEENITEELPENPMEVDEEVQNAVIEELGLVDKEEENNEDALAMPNIIFLQLESFFDPTEVVGLEFSQDPIPNFRKLMEDYSSGYLQVPSVGAGTANTEFEVLTGMNLDFFGPGEYPYKTILKQTTCESMAYNVKSLGYSTFAMHNNDGTFYDRHIVFSQLGFDCFIPIEYMYNYERNTNGFAKDEVLVEQIIETLSSTPAQQDLIYAISVQAHGVYPNTRLDDEEPIFIRYTDLSREIGISYYVNQIAEDDVFVKDLIEALEKRGEPTVLVMYGDHLPHFGWEAKDIVTGEITQTEYVIWDNIGLEREVRDLQSYQLAADVFGKINIHQGVLTQLHQNAYEDEDYLNKFEILQYDMLYGEKEIYGGVNPYIASDLKMGIHEIHIESAELMDNAIYIYGEYFNRFSEIYINGDPVDTTYVDENLILGKKSSLNPGDQIKISQVGTDGISLGSCEVFIYEE